jgi:DNA-binding NarL/FixJ family response regulator
MAFDAPEVVVVNAATVDLAVVVETVRSKGPIPVVAMSVAHTVADVSLCAEFGLAGFILADDSADDLLALVESATETNPQCPPRAVPMLMSALRRRRLRPDTDRLTEREWDVAHLLQEGLANKEIAARLGITARTVKNHLHHVYDKLGLHSRAEVAAMLSELDRRDAASRSLA